MLFYESSCQDGNFDISQSIFQNNFQIPMQILLSGLTRIFDQPTVALKSLLSNIYIFIKCLQIHKAYTKLMLILNIKKEVRIIKDHSKNLHMATQLHK